MPEQIVIYPAAALFNGRETYFNSKLVEGLETLGYKTNFPQRDGFEFGNLAKSLSGKLSQAEVDSAVQNVIYFLDMGVFIPQSDVIVANLDEPLDEGMVAEITYGNLIGKYGIGFRTDVRGPYGPADGRFGGMHFFPAYQCRSFLSHYMPCRTANEGDAYMEELALKISKAIRDSGVVHGSELPAYAKENPQVASILNGAGLLFSEVRDMHSENGLEEIAQRYLDNRNFLEKIGPKLYSKVSDGT